MKTIKRLLKGEGGFTLIELLAVMAIVATLSGIVSTSVSGSNETSKTAAAQQDASTTTSSAGAYFADREAAEVLGSSTVTVTALFNDEVAGDSVASEQKISTRWPETSITQAFASVDDAATTPYSNEFPTANAPTVNIVKKINILGEADSDGIRVAISRRDLLKGYTAVDFDKLVGDPQDLENTPGGYSEKVPGSATQTTEALEANFHNFLWLFKKTTSAGGSGTDDSRVISIFKLERVDTLTTGETDTVELTYVQIF